MTQRLFGVPDNMDEEQQALYNKIASGPRGRVAGPLALWLNSPKLAERAQALGEHLRFNNVFPKKLSEMVILQVAAHHRCEFEWYVHAPIALREGLESRVVEAIRTQEDPGHLDADALAVFSMVKGLLTRDMVNDAAYSKFMKLFGPAGLVELTALIGYYQIGAHLLNAVEHPVPDGPPAFRRKPLTG